jgi:hypothetical protein
VLFFAWFDAGVGIGGPIVGAVASLTDPGGALDAAATTVAGAILITASSTRASATPQAPRARPATTVQLREPTDQQAGNRSRNPTNHPNSAQPR